MKSRVVQPNVVVNFTPVVVLALFVASCAGEGGQPQPTPDAVGPMPPNASPMPNLGTTPSGVAPGSSPTPGNSNSSPGTSTPTTSEAVAPQPIPADAVPGTSRLLRLSHPQFDRVLSDLLAMEVAVTSDFPEEVATLDGYFEEAALTVNDRLKTEIAGTAERLSASVVTTPLAYQAVVGCDTADSMCRDAFVARFIERAYRRPPSTEESAAYTALFDRGHELIGSGDDFRDGVQMVVEAALQSPQFLYRVEVGSSETDELGTLLTPYELASRISFLFWGTMPDEELFAAARDGSLATPAEFEVQLQRAANDPRVSQRSADFHERWLQLASLAGATKDAELYPFYDANLVASMREETRRFIHEVTVEEAGGIVELLTAPYGFVDGSLNAIYGFDGDFGDAFSRVEYPASSPRGGLLTQAAFLSGHSSSATTTSPILRGTFVLRRLACIDIPEPPANAVSQMPPAPSQPPVTTRDLFTWKTSLDECSSCHTLINPVGFAFEEFDTVGRHRTEENGAPVDSNGQLSVSQTLTFNGAKELSTQLAGLTETAACYASNWLEYAYGRPATEADEATLMDLRESLRAPGFGAKQTLLRLARSAAFTHISLQ